MKYYDDDTLWGDDDLYRDNLNLTFEIQDLKRTVDTLYKYIKTKTEPDCNYCVWLDSYPGVNNLWIL